jgi:hypothetical protein
VCRVEATPRRPCIQPSGVIAEYLNLALGSSPLYSPVNNQTIPLSGRRKTSFDIFQKRYFR